MRGQIWMNHLHWDLTQLKMVMKHLCFGNQQFRISNSAASIKKCDWTIKIGDPTFKMMIETSIVGLKKWTRETTMTKQWHLNINEWTWIGETYKDLSHQKKGWDLVKNSKMDQHFQFGKYDNLSMHSVKWLHIECEQMEVELVYRHSQGLCLQSI